MKKSKRIPVSKKAVETLVGADLLSGIDYEANEKMLAERANINIMIPAMEDETIIGIFKDGFDGYVYDKIELAEMAEQVIENVKAYQK